MEFAFSFFFFELFINSSYRGTTSGEEGGETIDTERHMLVLNKRNTNTNKKKIILKAFRRKIFIIRFHFNKKKEYMRAY